MASVHSVYLKNRLNVMKPRHSWPRVSRAPPLVQRKSIWFLYSSHFESYWLVPMNLERDSAAHRQDTKAAGLRKACVRGGSVNANKFFCSACLKSLVLSFLHDSIRCSFGICHSLRSKPRPASAYSYLRALILCRRPGCLGLFEMGNGQSLLQRLIDLWYEEGSCYASPLF